jgi:hypothetical protein
MANEGLSSLREISVLKQKNQGFQSMIMVFFNATTRTLVDEFPSRILPLFWKEEALKTKVESRSETLVLLTRRHIRIESKLNIHRYEKIRCYLKP